MAAPMRVMTAILIATAIMTTAGVVRGVTYALTHAAQFTRTAGGQALPDR